MVLGFNHNIRYRGELFHVQTEDSGLANPHIITLLYLGGTILCSKKTSYADIIKADQLEQVVESIMKEQHKEMMRRLKSGEFDARVFPNACSAPQQEQPQEQEVSQPQQVVQQPPQPQPPQQQRQQPQQIPPAPPASPTATKSLDEVILDYLITGEDK